MGCLNKAWLILQTSNCKWATVLSILVVIAYFSVTLRDARSARHCFLHSCKTEATGAELTFHHNITENFMANKILLKHIYCSYSRTHNIQNGFLHSLLLFLGHHCCWTETNILVKNFMLFVSLHFPQYFYWSLPYHCFGCYLCLFNFTFKLSISTDMIIEIQITKMLAKLLTESRWR